LLFTVVLAIVQFGILFNEQLNLTDAVRTGARTASLSAGAADPIGAAKAAVLSADGGLGLTSDDVKVTSTWQPGAPVTVSANYDYTRSILGIPVKSGSLTSATTERVE
jgi:Flp pilus assembly protein TadG